MTQTVLNKLRDFFSTQPVEKAWLFGSYSRGEETDSSDVDIMVSYTPGYRPGLFGICRLTEMGCPFPVVRFQIMHFAL